MHFNVVHHNTSQCNRAELSTLQCNAMQYNTVYYSKLKYSTGQYCLVIFLTMISHIINKENEYSF